MLQNLPQEVNKKELTDKLDLIDYAYDASCNQFV